VELVADRQTKRPFPFEERMGHRVCMACREHGVILRPLGDVVVLMPPLAVSIEELDLLFEVTATAIQECIL
jgi:adenosylmethionine-8-amino-7-oxononanoate aminotransferase